MSWISVKDRLPEDDREVVVMVNLPIDRRYSSVPYKITMSSKYVNGNGSSWWAIRDGDTDLARNITHWIDYPKE